MQTLQILFLAVFLHSLPRHVNGMPELRSMEHKESQYCAYQTTNPIHSPHPDPNKQSLDGYPLVS